MSEASEKLAAKELEYNELLTSVGGNVMEKANNIQRLLTEIIRLKMEVAKENG